MPLPVIEYDHHGKRVFVREDLKGRHREHCLCYSCARLVPGLPDNCPIAQALFENCVRFDVVTPVWECPQYVANEVG